MTESSSTGLRPVSALFGDATPEIVKIFTKSLGLDVGTDPFMIADAYLKHGIFKDDAGQWETHMPISMRGRPSGDSLGLGTIDFREEEDLAKGVVRELETTGWKEDSKTFKAKFRLYQEQRQAFRIMHTFGTLSRFVMLNPLELIELLMMLPVCMVHEDRGALDLPPTDPLGVVTGLGDRESDVLADFRESQWLFDYLQIFDLGITRPSERFHPASKLSEEQRTMIATILKKKLFDHLLILSPNVRATALRLKVDGDLKLPRTKTWFVLLGVTERSHYVCPIALFDRNWTVGDQVTDDPRLLKGRTAKALDHFVAVLTKKEMRDKKWRQHMLGTNMIRIGDRDPSTGRSIQDRLKGFRGIDVADVAMPLAFLGQASLIPPLLKEEEEEVEASKAPLLRRLVQWFPTRLQRIASWWRRSSWWRRLWHIFWVTLMLIIAIPVVGFLVLMIGIALDI